MEPPKTRRQKRDELLQDARDNPGSEAGEMLQALVLAGISRLEPDSGVAEAELDLEDARVRYQGFRQQNPKAGAEGGSQRVVEQLWERTQKLKQVQEATAEAQAALAAGQPMDALAVCNRIAEIVGLRAPETAGG